MARVFGRSDMTEAVTWVRQPGRSRRSFLPTQAFPVRQLNASNSTSAPVPHPQGHPGASDGHVVKGGAILQDWNDGIGRQRGVEPEVSQGQLHQRQQPLIGNLSPGQPEKFQLLELGKIPQIT